MSEKNLSSAVTDDKTNNDVVYNNTTPKDLNLSISEKRKIITYFDTIPKELKEDKKWFNWEYGDYDSKKNKFAKKPCARFFDTYNPDKWLSFDQAKDNCIKSDGKEGMAYVLKDSDYIFVDIDGIDKDKNSKNIMEILNKIKSYTELSIYGKGLHIIFKGSALDFPRNVINVEGCDHIEIYNGKDKRWFAITGKLPTDFVHTISEPLDIEWVKNILNSTKQIKNNINENIKELTLPNDPESYPQCIKNTIKKLQCGDGTPHEARVNLVIFLKKLGLLPIEIGEYFKKSDDFDATKTMAQILHIYNGTYKLTYNCSKIKKFKIEKDELPICNIETCNVKNPLPLYISTLKNNDLKLTKNGDLIKNPYTNELTEIGLSEQFSSEYEGKIIYNAKNHRWFEWNGCIFYPDPSKKGDVEVSSEILKKLRNIYNLIQSISDVNKKISKFTDKIQTNSSINNILKNMMLSNKIKIYNTDIYPNIYTLNNGTLNVDDNIFKSEFVKSNYCTKMIYIDYDKSKTCNKWIKHLETIFLKPIINDNGETVYVTDYDMIESFQISVGYTFMNGQPAQRLFLLWGNGRNGKSITTNVLSSILGDFAEQTTFKVISERNPNDTRQDLFKYKDAHFLVISEAQDNKSKSTFIDAALLKTITGGEKIDARALYDNGDKGFIMRSKIWMMSNDLPSSNDNSYAFWRRILVYPFYKQFSDDEKIDDYQNILLEEKEGILQWMLEGFEKYKQFGLKETKTMIDMKKEYREDQDYSYEFICYKINSRMNKNIDLYNNGHQELLFEDIKTKDLYNEFTVWWREEKDEKHQPPIKKNFYTKISKLQDVSKVIKNGYDFYRIKIPSIIKEKQEKL